MGYSTTTFFTACNRSYEPFVLPYAASVLHHNDDAVVEVCVEDSERFAAERKVALAIVNEAFPDRLLVRAGNFRGLMPHKVRFLETPRLRNEYTYIGDADILILDRTITTAHLASMAATRLPYSNILRPGHDDRLSGLHFTRTDVHYPLVIPTNFRSLFDEAMLYQIVVGKGLPLPEPAHRFRPAHGYHLSLQRPPTRRTVGRVQIDWALAPIYLNAYLALIETPFWRDLAPRFDPAYRALLAVLDAVLQSQHPDRDIYRPEFVKTLFDAPWQDAG